MTSPSDSTSGTGPPRSHGTEPQHDSINDSLTFVANRGWQIVLTTGLAAIALGIVALAWPGATLRVVGVLFGIYLLIAGVFQLAAAFGSHVPGHLRALHFLVGALSIVLGLICFRGTLESILLLALWIGFGWLLRGVMLTVTAASAPGMPARGWMFFWGIVGTLAGIALIVSPFTSIAALTLTVGVIAVVLGVVEVFYAVRMRLDIGRLELGTARERRSRFHSQPHPQH
ncbi:HdeD family acid-resistance protein [Actinacidiphila acidipaludis]|uniref:HdeD family acid-resistance protein n=1 Tax=Actinacidiphila acidipaludis TaxID=2873382 RepID=A0ABS7QE44_9ACTN|nr:HdeD family acid-resistance protein [Streptomyces acidipaludis]MBY8880695.1 HdeD family acid-resistance protein [Streptomyces acidipaludis]